MSRAIKRIKGQKQTHTEEKSGKDTSELETEQRTGNTNATYWQKI